MNVIKINEELYPLKFGINSMIEFEALTGKPIDAELNGGEFGLGILRTLFHVGLRGGNPNYAGHIFETGVLLEQAMEQYGVEQFGDIISKSLEQSMGKLSAQAPVPPQIINKTKKTKKKKRKN